MQIFEALWFINFMLGTYLLAGLLNHQVVVNITILKRTIKRQIGDFTTTTKTSRYKFIEQTNRRMKQKSIFFEDIGNFVKFVFECEK